MPRYDNPLIHVALFQPEIPPNTGNVSRLSAANRLPLHLIGKLGFSLDAKALRRAGLDYWPEVDLRLHEDFAAFAAELGTERLFCYTARGSRNFTKVEHRPGDILLFGPERTGLPAEILDAVPPERRLRIPFPNAAVRCLNLSTAVGVGVYEALRQLRGDEE